MNNPEIFGKLLLLSVLMTFSTGLNAQNPFIRHMYTADPSGHVFDGRLYVYPSHDRDSSHTFDMVDYHVFSTENMKDWKDHGMVLSVDEVSWATGKAWAPDCNYYKGKYYFYFPTRAGVEPLE